jgi:hypothetical protein
LFTLPLSKIYGVLYYRDVPCTDALNFWPGTAGVNKNPSSMIPQAGMGMHGYTAPTADVVQTWTVSATPTQ